MEGTLGWSGMIDVHLGEVAMHGYDDLQIVMIDVPAAIARERSLARWWDERDDPTTELGGRFVPQAVIDSCYSGGSNASATVCRRNADEMNRRARRMEGLQVRMLETSLDGQDPASSDNTVVQFRVVGEG